MGNTIGDYIHYRAINYVRYGTNRANGGNGSFNLSSVVTAQKSRLQESIAMSKRMGVGNQARDIARKIQWLMRPPDSRVIGAYGAGESEDEYNLIWQTLLPFLEAEFGDATERIARGLGNVFSLIGGIDAFSKIKVSDNQKYVHAGTINARLNAIQQVVDGIVTKYSITDQLTGERTTKEYTTREIEDIKVFYQKLMNLKSQLNDEVIKALDANQQGKTGILGKQLSLDDSLRSYIKEINKLSALGRGAAARYKGILFEDMIVAAMYAGKGLTAEALKKAIGEGLGGIEGSANKVVGNVSTSVIYDPKDFMTDNLSSILSNNYKQVGDLFVATRPSKDKVDVQIQLELNGELKTVNISAKNKSLTSTHAQPIDLVSSSPFLALLASLQNHDLVNHYLNQHVERSYRAETGYNAGAASTLYTETARIMSLSIIEQAFRGYKKNSSKADVFVINDNASGIVQVFDIADILNEFLNLDLNELNNCAVINPDISSMTYPNTWSEVSAEDRISKILAVLHNIKITVHILPSYFSKNLPIGFA